MLNFHLNMFGLVLIKSRGIGRTIDVWAELPMFTFAAGELYYLRLLLNYQKGAFSFDYLRTIKGVIQPTI